MNADQSLTDPKFIRRLESLYLLARRVLGGSLQSDRRSTRKGSGITFADYAEYQLGDDYRSIDWRVFARFDELVVKLFELEEDATICILLDISPSMKSKFYEAKQLAAALGYIALNCLDRLCVYSLSDRLDTVLEPTRGRSQVFSFLRKLERLETRGNDTNFLAACKGFQARRHRKAVVIAISDFLYPAGYSDGLKLLNWRGHDVFCLQIHDAADLSCDWKGDIDLRCAETQESLRVTVSPAEAKAYKAAMEEWNSGLKQDCARMGLGLASITHDVPFDTVIQGILRKGGLLS